MAETIVGLNALHRRMAAVSGGAFGVTVMRKLALSTVREAKLIVPRKTGNLGRSIHVASVTERTALVVASARYAGFVERGTRAHDIRPNAKKALFFASQGITTARFGAGAKLTFRKSGALSAGSVRKYGNAAFVLTKLVHHPGTRAEPYMVPGARAAVTKSGLRDAVIKLWDDAA